MSQQMPPNYVRAATFNNKAGMGVKLLAFFDSGAKEEYKVANESSVKVEKTIDKGSWTAADPIKRVELTGADGQNCAFDLVAQGVEIQTYVISVSAGKLVCEKQ